VVGKGCAGAGRAHAVVLGKRSALPTKLNDHTIQLGTLHTHARAAAFSSVQKPAGKKQI